METINIMKLKREQPIDITAFFDRLKFVQENHRDFLIPEEKKISYSVIDKTPVMKFDSTEAAFKMLPNAKQQTYESLQIPGTYADRILKEKPDLWEHTMNRLSQDSEKPRLVRTIVNEGRAVLSNRFKSIDNYPIFFKALSTTRDYKPEFYGASLTDDNMFLRAGFPGITAEIRKGDIVESGIFIKNSETGNGRFEANLYINRLACLNGLISKENNISKTHLGKVRNFEVGQAVIEAEGRLIEEEVKDLLQKALNPGKFDKMVSKLRESTEIKIEKPIEEIKEVGYSFKMSENEIELLTNAFIVNKDFTKYGEIQAVTQIAKDFSADRRTELETNASNLLAF